MFGTRHIYVSTVVASGVGFTTGLLCEKLFEDVRKMFGGKSPGGEKSENVTSKFHPGHEVYAKAIEKSQQSIRRFKEQSGSPGVVVGVSVDGRIIWEEGFGLANVETVTPCVPETAMRIASISKPITMALAAKLWESGTINLDTPIEKYISMFPAKKVGSDDVTITLRQLASHTAGVRHYKKKSEVAVGEDADSGPEFYLKTKFDSLGEAVGLFKDDELLFKPGTSFHYTTHGYTLISAVLEEAAKKPFTQQLPLLFKALGMASTHLDQVNSLIPNRASYYAKSGTGALMNAELADTSYKWAGGGLVSTVGDLLRFANAMLYSYQQNTNGKPGYLKQETVKALWTPEQHTKMSWGENSGYGLGWTVVPSLDKVGGVAEQQFSVGHGGGAVGASSVLYILPTPSKDANNNTPATGNPPEGVVVAILVNLEDVSCYKAAKQVAEAFQDVSKQAK